jgi:hypothetical protein
MKAALTTRRTLFKGTQAMMVERPSSLAAICVLRTSIIQHMLNDCFIDVLEVQHVN